MNENHNYSSYVHYMKQTGNILTQQVCLSYIKVVQGSDNKQVQSPLKGFLVG